MCAYVLSCFSRIWLFETLWTAVCQAPLSMGFLREEHWSGLPFPFSRDLPDSGIEPTSPALAGRFLIIEPPGKLQISNYNTGFQNLYFIKLLLKALIYIYIYIFLPSEVQLLYLRWSIRCFEATKGKRKSNYKLT